jgi:hypothetical protein
MAILSALLAPGAILATLGRRTGRIAAGRLRRVARRPPDPALELRDPLVLRTNALLKTLDLLVHPQQDRDNYIAALVIDRFGLNALHNRKIPCKSRKPCPKTNGLNAYSFLFLAVRSELRRVLSEGRFGRQVCFTS